MWSPGSGDTFWRDLLSLQITPRESYSISNVVVKWIKNHEKNSKFCGKRMDELTYYQMSMASKYDCGVMWSVMENVFPQLEVLRSWDRDALLRNFQPKWSFLSAAIDFYKNREAYSTIRTEEDYCNMIVKFYNQSTYEDCEMEPEEILRIFLPFQSFYGLSLAVPISQKKFDSVEFTALAMMALFDGGGKPVCPDVQVSVSLYVSPLFRTSGCPQCRFV
ncbi:CBN-NHR-63 protein [Caenorhabditis brenneri]|uniref:CBN-NHR-63 protein n=1 Tax=Caenorhabditis brenneri TaxID=135651 RepID=G0N2X1_CAEBE|nr:CBN-NHR-63 protein [Caenorhabditis brenneri]